jgi:hypothetical protein
MINKAKHPENLVICICQQNDISDSECGIINGNIIGTSIDSKKNNNVIVNSISGAIIKKIILTNYDARGPCWARFLIQQEWTGEEYFLQIDSHMRFVDNWDEKCIKELNELPDKSCLTNYVSNFDLKTGAPEEKNPLRGPLQIVNKETNSTDGFFRVNSNYIKEASTPMLSYGWSACFSFSRSDILHVASYDPYTPYLFFGEEMDIWARMFTNGWYVYAPYEPICFTSFDRSYRKTFWEHPDQAKSEYLSRLRLYYKFGYLSDIPDRIKIDLDKYNLGKDKTWDEFMKFCLDEEQRAVHSTP